MKEITLSSGKPVSTNKMRWRPYPEITQVQLNILAPYRLTDEFRREYGKYLVDKYPESERVEAAIKAIKLYEDTEEVNLETHREQIEDMVYTRIVLGLRMYEYITYGLKNLTPVERAEFLPEEHRIQFYKEVNKDRQSIWKLDNKFLTYKQIGFAFKREMFEIRGQEQKREFLEYCERHDRAVLKPTINWGGHGVKFLSLNDYPDKEALFDSLIKEYAVTSTNALLCEEAIIQHPELGSMHPSSVNSIRVFTYNDGTDVDLICAWVKSGRGGAVMDNLTVGRGMLAAVDRFTGRVFTDGFDEMGHHFPVQPDTGFVFKGFHIPLWEEVVDCVKECAKAFPNMAVIGWDVAVSKDRGPQIVEGNAWGMINLYQIATKHGFYRRFLRRIGIKRRLY